MNFTELHKILDDENRKLSLDELKQMIYELKQDAFNEMSKSKLASRNYIWYEGEQNAFQIVLDLLEHLTSSNESDLEKRVKVLEDYNEQQKQMKIAQLKAENDMLETQLKSKGLPSFEDWFKEQRKDIK